MKKRLKLTFDQLEKEMELEGSILSSPMELSAITGGETPEGQTLDEVVVYGYYFKNDSSYLNTWNSLWYLNCGYYSSGSYSSGQYSYGGYDGNNSTELTPEQKWALSHPLAATQAYQNSTIAASAVEKMPGKYNGVGDAFRHAYWMALNTAKFGKTQALELGIAHEDSTPGPMPERLMDLNNNSWGANWLINNPEFDLQKFVTDFNTAVQSGAIIILDGGKTTVTPYNGY